MAVKYAIVGGVWSNPAIWNGGTKPQPGDTVHSNGYYIDVNESFNIAMLTNGPNAGLGIITGGYFNCNGSGNLVLTADIENYQGYTLLTNHNGAIVINGSSYSCVGGYYGIYINSSMYPVTINGNVDSRLGSQYACTVYGSGGLTINGNAVGGTLNVNAKGLYVGSSGGNVILNGNVIANAAEGLSSTCSNNSTITINGDSVASNSSYGLTNNSYPCKIIINGSAIPSGTYGGIYNPYFQADVIIKTSEYRPYFNSSTHGVWGYFRFMQTGATVVAVLEDGTQAVLTVGGDIAGQLPNESDVRLGVEYSLGTKTGTCAIPSKEAVGFGVPVDDTEGEAVFSFADWLAALQASNNPVAQRLRNVATPEAVTAIIDTSLNG